MSDRRTAPRLRSYLGAQVAFNHRSSTMDCLVRNISPQGARLAFPGAAPLPQEFDLVVSQKGISTRARIVWRTERDMGVVFLDEAPEAKGAEIVPLAYAKRLRDCEKEREALKRRLDGDFIG